MQCPNSERAATVDEGAQAHVVQSKRVRKLATASLVLAILSCCLLWAALLCSPGLSGLRSHWRPPFVARLIPLSLLPFAGAKMIALFMALAAIVTGHMAITKGRRVPGTGGFGWLPLLIALVAYLALPWIILGGDLHWRALHSAGLRNKHLFLQLFMLAAYFIAVAAFIFVHVATTRLRRVRGTGGLTWRPLIGAMVGYFNVALISLLALPLFGKIPVNLDMSVCSHNLRRIESVLREYAEENRGMFPPLSSQPGVLMFPAEAIPHEAIPQKEDIGPSLTCTTIRFSNQPTTGPVSPFDDQSYFYLGYALLNDDAVEAFAQAYRKRISEGGTFDEDLVVEDAEGTHILHRLSKDVRDVLRASQDRLSISPNAGKAGGYPFPGMITDDVPILTRHSRNRVFS